MESLPPPMTHSVTGAYVLRTSGIIKDVSHFVEPNASTSLHSCQLGDRHTVALHTA
jgi:DNA integrity scanning protein DisA with diadenylate cyclase activity